MPIAIWRQIRREKHNVLPAQNQVNIQPYAHKDIRFPHALDT